MKASRSTSSQDFQSLKNQLSQFKNIDKMVQDSERQHTSRQYPQRTTSDVANVKIKKERKTKQQRNEKKNGFESYYAPLEKAASPAKPVRVSRKPQNRSKFENQWLQHDAFKT